MPKLDLALQATPQGMMMLVLPEGKEPLAIPLPLERAIDLFWDFWRCLGSHYLPADSQGDASVPPRMAETGDFQANVFGASSGQVMLWLRPAECAGIAYELTPGQARELGHSLLGAADQMESFVSPN